MFAEAPPATAPSGTVALGSVRLPKGVKADGKPLAAGTYQVRVTTDAPSQAAPGESPGLERWAEFLKGGKVVGREVVTIVPQAEIKQVEKDTPPAANSSKVETLKGGDYVRLWINKGGNHYLVHFPTAQPGSVIRDLGLAIWDCYKFESWSRITIPYSLVTSHSAF